MKFILKKISNNGLRRGVISQLSRLPGVELETPLLILYTKGGSIPHVSREVLDLVTKEQLAIQISLPSTIQCFESVTAFENGISKFVGLQEMVTFCAVQDPGVVTPSGYNTHSEVSVWSYTGRAIMKAEKFMEIMEAFQPDIYEALSNGDTNKHSSRKKVKKVVESSDYLLDQCLEKHKISEVLKSKGILGSIEGGYDLEQRKKSAKLVASKDVDGFVINGLHNNGPEVEKIDFTEVKPILEEVLKNLPEDKPRMVHGCWRPEHVLEMVDLGIDLFDASLAFIAAERDSALIFNFSEKVYDTEEEKKEYEIHLSDPKYKEDFQPILSSCECLTCKKHTRAYIYHLQENKELLGRTLLMIHNLHHYMEFFKSIRRYATEGKKLHIL